MKTSRSLALALLALPALASAQKPLTLDEALALAARQNADLVVAREEAASASADSTTAWSGVLPRLDLSASAGQTRRRGTGTFFNEVTGELETVEDQLTVNAAYSVDASLSQPLFDWSAFRNISRASAAQVAAQRRYDEAVLGVAFDVTRLFYEVVRAERSLSVLETTAARTEELVRRADALFSAGKSTRADTYTNRVNLGNDRIAVEGQRVRVVQARTALAQALGNVDAGSTDLEVVPPQALDGSVTKPVDPPPLASILETARKRRPTLAAAQAAVSSARASVGQAQGGYLPVIDARVRYGRTGSEPSGEGGVVGDPTKDYNASALLVLSWNLFEGRATSASIRRAESQVRRAQADEARTLQSVAKEISDAHAQVVSNAAQVKLAADNLTTAQQALALARERLEAGLATQLEVREANLNLTRAELSLVEARIDHAIALADLARASGGPL